ncbi:MAG: Fic family protein [Candidatus Saccharibacteria bacterium]
MANYFTNSHEVLDNKLNITDPVLFNIKEQSIVTKKSAIILKEFPKVYNFDYLKHIHKVLFEDIYDFAGNTRTVNITKPDSNTPFAHFEYIGSGAERIFSILKQQDYLANLKREDYAIKIADLAADLNALHPFREGNGRSIRLFLIKISDHNGFILDYSQVSSKDLIQADKEAFEGNNDSLIKIYEKAILATRN